MGAHVRSHTAEAGGEWKEILLSQLLWDLLLGMAVRHGCTDTALNCSLPRACSAGKGSEGGLGALRSRGTGVVLA